MNFNLITIKIYWNSFAISYLDRSSPNEAPGANWRKIEKSGLFYPRDKLCFVVLWQPYQAICSKTTRIFILNWTQTEMKQIYHYGTFCPNTDTLPPATITTKLMAFALIQVFMKIIWVSKDCSKYLNPSVPEHARMLEEFYWMLT